VPGPKQEEQGSNRYNFEWFKRVVQDDPAKGVPEMGVQKAGKRPINIRDAKSGKNCGSKKAVKPNTERNRAGRSKPSHDSSLSDISKPAQIGRGRVICTAPESRAIRN
jgi:hypothetical protein